MQYSDQKPRKRRYRKNLNHKVNKYRKCILWLQSAAFEKFQNFISSQILLPYCQNQLVALETYKRY
jgi:hypothetical protein